MKFATIALFLGTISAQEFDEELINELKISISPAGERAIEKEAKDVKMTMKKIANSKPVRNLEASLKRWAHTKEVHHLEAVDRAFLKSKAGQRLIAEWKDVGEVLKKNLHRQKDGSLHFDNKHVDNLSDELDDVADQYESLDGGKWDKAYTRAWKKALKTKQAQSVFRRAKAFKGSNEGKMLHKEMVELKRSVKKNLKITDMPDLDSSDDEEEFEELASTLKIKVTEEGRKEINGELHKFKVSEEKLMKTAAYKKFGADIKVWLKTKEVQRIANVERAYYASDEGQALLKDWKAFGIAIKKAMKKDGISNEEINGEIQDEFDDVVDHYDKAFASKNKWLPMYKKAWIEALKNKEAQTAYADHKKMEATKEYKAHNKDWEALLKSVDNKENVQISDLPKKFKISDWDNESDSMSDDSDDEEELFSFAEAKKTKVERQAEKKAAYEKAKAEKKAAADKAAADKAAAAKKGAEQKAAEGKKAADKAAADKKAAAAKKAAAKKGGKKADSDSDSSDDEEDLIKISINKAGRKVIKKEWNDVEHVWDRIENSKPVRNLESSLKRFGNSKEMKDIEALDKKFLSTKRGKKMAREVKDVFQQLDKSIYHNKAGLQINNKELNDVDDELKDVESEFKSFKKSKWQKIYEQKVGAALNNKQAKSVHRRMVAFKKSPQAKALKKEMHEFKLALKHNVKVTDLPKNFEEDVKEAEKKDEDKLYLF